MNVRMINCDRERLIALSIILSFMILSSNLLGQELIIIHGATISVVTKDGLIFKGELLKVKQNSLRIMIPDSVNSHSIDIGNIMFIRIGRSVALGVIIGIIAGSVLLGVPTKEIIDNFEGGSSVSEALKPISIGVGAIIGGYLGGVISGEDKIIQIEGESQDKIRASLKYLKSKERKEQTVIYE